MPSLSFLVARSHPGHVIGCDNRLPWHLKSDLARFKAITLGHVIVMGRKTHESVGRALPGRTTIVLSRRPAAAGDQDLSDLPDTALVWSADQEHALYLADMLSIARGADEFFVIGGAEIFAMFSPLANTVYLTEVFAEVAGEARFDLEFDDAGWRRVRDEQHPQSAGDQYATRFLVFERRDRHARCRVFSEAAPEGPDRRDWARRQLRRLSDGNLIAPPDP